VLVGKVPTTIFWESKGVLLVDYLPQKTTMTRQYCGKVLRNRHQAIKDKRRRMLTKRSAASVRQCTGAHGSSCTGCRKGHWIRTALTVTLLNRAGTQWLLPISSSEDWGSTFMEQGFTMIMRSNRPLSRIWTACYKNSIWLASKSFLTDVANALLLGAFVLKNNIKILLVSFVHYIELQNFLIAPHMPYSCTFSALMLLVGRHPTCNRSCFSSSRQFTLRTAITWNNHVE